MAGIARIGDTISHGGEIVGGSENARVNGRRVARRGDPVACAIHGSQTITGGSDNVRVNGRGVARLGDLISCGADITSASTNARANG